MHLFSEKFVSLVFDGRYDEADEILCAQREAAAGVVVLRLVGVREAMRAKVQQLGFGPSDQRRVLACTYETAYRLREQKYWNDAATIYLDVVELSLAMNEPFVLDDARLSRVLCLKNLGRIHEYEREKAEIPAGTTILIDGVNWRVEDL
ncbi:MAG TPA: hypothetical protein VNK51_07130 [Bradyrhizobium sp.]|nr:hypothetical protein [Bradyrhizobium sp.]